VEERTKPFFHEDYCGVLLVHQLAEFSRTVEANSTPKNIEDVQEFLVRKHFAHVFLLIAGDDSE
jgi:hypothetical protein